MKRKLLSLLAAVMLCTSPVYAGDITVNVNGSPVAFEGGAAVIINNRTMIPLRGVFEQLGYSITWDAATKSATLAGKERITVTAGSPRIIVGDDIEYSDVPAQIIDGRMYLPLRAIGEAADMDVKWDANTKTAYIGDYEDMVEQVLIDRVQVDSDAEKLVKDLFSISLLSGLADEFEDYIEDGKGTRAEYVAAVKEALAAAELTTPEYVTELNAILDNSSLTNIQMENQLDAYTDKLEIAEDAMSAELNKILAAAGGTFNAKMQSVLSTAFAMDDDDFTPDRFADFLGYIGQAMEKAAQELNTITPANEAEEKALTVYKTMVGCVRNFATTDFQSLMGMDIDDLDDLFG